MRRVRLDVSDVPSPECTANESVTKPQSKRSGLGGPARELNAKTP